LDRTGPALADSLFPAAAAAAVLLAVGATVLGGVITARRRGYELAALQVIGVAPRTLRRSTAAEQGLVLGVGLVIGLAAGIGGSLLALPSTPFFVSEATGPPRDNSLPWLLLLVLVAALVVLFALTSVVMARFVARQATPGRLREAQE
jgi:putative ABC transport system permease protein